MGTVTLILPLTTLAIRAVLPPIPSRGRGRSGRNASTRVILIGLGTGVISSFILTLVDTPFPKVVNRQGVTLWTLPSVIDLVIGVMVLRGFMSRKEHPSVSFESALRFTTGTYFVPAVFHNAPQAMAQAVMTFPVGSELLSAQMALIFVGYVPGWVVAALLGVLAFRLLSLSRCRWVMNRILVVSTLMHLMFIARILQA